MIKGSRKSELNKENILKKISTYDIYRFYHGNFKVNEVTVNRHRGEKDPSLIIGNKVSEELTHKDFGDYSWRGDAFHFVMQIHGCDFMTALKLIDKDFNLGLGNEKVIVGRKIVTWEQPEILTKKPPIIQIQTLTKLTPEGMRFWSDHYQGEEDIKREHIYMPKEIWRNKRRIYLGNLLTFCYYYPTLNCWKIYRPHADKKEKNSPLHKWKWDTNLPFDYVENLDGLVGCKKGFLGKSKKDRMVLMKALETECIANTQAEDPACVSPRTIEIFQDIPERYAIMDNDKKGKECSWWLTKEHGFKHVNVPDKHLIETPPTTDFAGMAFNYNLDKVTQHFKTKGII